MLKIQAIFSKGGDNEMSSSTDNTKKGKNDKKQNDKASGATTLRMATLQVGSAGGNSGVNSVYYRVKIPNIWATCLGFSKEDKDVVIVLREDKQEIAVIKREFYEEHYGKIE